MQDDSDKMLAFELGQIARGGPLAFNKATILEAIDRLSALLAERDEIESMNQQQALRLMEQESARISAEAKLDAVTKDAEALREAAAHSDVQYHLLLGKYDALDGKLNAVTKDAERYRFLRDEEAHRPFGRYPVIVGRFGQELDTAIDAAMQQRTAITDQGRAGGGS